MNESSSHNTPEPGQDQLAALRYQFTSALILLAGIAIVTTWYFANETWYRYEDSSRAAKSANEIATQLNQFTQVNEPQFREYVRRLQDYSKSHPDILPILNKYGIMQMTNAPVTAPKK